MQVETYENPEIQEMDLEGHEALCNKLGLEGQKGVKRHPFSPMTALQFAVYSTVFSEHASVKEFDKETIPTRVLEVLEVATEQGMFDKIEVWYRKPGEKDPLLVGLQTKKWPTAHYLLARWGDALAPFSAIEREARKILDRDFGKAILDLQNARKKLAELGLGVCTGQPSVSVYINGI